VACTVQLGQVGLLPVEAGAAFGEKKVEELAGGAAIALTQPPQWTQTEIGGEVYRHPLCLRAYFPAGTLLTDTGCVIEIEARQSMMRSAEVSAFVTPEAQDQARVVLDRLAERANELNPYRGRALRATYTQGLSSDVIALSASARRQTVIVPDEVWAEVELSLTACATATPC
jgi:cell division protease FtsH